MIKRCCQYIVLILVTIAMSTHSFAVNDPTKTGTAKSNQPDSSYTGGKIAFDTEAWDFGYSPGNALVRHIFTIKNNGEEDLRILKVKPTCGCTSAPLKKKVLAPGEQTELDVGFKTLRFKGAVEKHIKITSSDPENGDVKLAFTAIVDEPHPVLRIYPDKFDFVQIKEGESAEQHVNITNITVQPAKLYYVDTPSRDYLEYELEKNELQPGETAKLNVKIKENAPNGVLRESITFALESEDSARISVPIKAEIIDKTYGSR
ncbi:MAG: DUF1573 domain-containing protein [candidate division Zixibacteria bacterium]|nr:DUF1573 domain-containing protein [candidate division Zixibacteria bacterium]